jgi:hypothetical protein
MGLSRKTALESNPDPAGKGPEKAGFWVEQDAFWRFYEKLC